MTFLETVRHLFTPHTTNNHRARATHPASIFFYILLFVFVQLSFQFIHTVKPDILGYATDISVEELLRHTNEKRAANGLPPLGYNNRLADAARRKAVDMFNKDYWAHNAPDGSSPWSFITAAGYDYLVAGENLAKNFNDSNGVVEAWMASPSHRDNLLKGDYEDIGFAVVDGKLQGEETTLVVQMFGKAKGSRLAKVGEQSTVNAAEVPPTAIPPTATPTLIPAPIAETTTIPTLIAAAPAERTNRGGLSNVEIVPYEIAGVHNRPLFDIRSLQKSISLFVLIFLVIVFTIDGYFIWAHKKVRIAGRNWAHIIFILTLLGIIWFSKSGSVL